MACEFRDCEVETMLGRLPNGVVALAAEIIVTTWIYFGKMSIIVPSSKFISEAVTNITCRIKRTCIIVYVGVSYRSDEELVKKVLLGVANSHPDILKNIDTEAPEVQLPSVRMGDSSLDFELPARIR